MTTATTRARKPREKRATWSNPPKWLVEWATGGGTTASGVSVNETTALRCSTVFACISAIASDVAKLPFCVFRRTETLKEKAPNHPMYWLLHNQPNPLMTAFDLRRVITAHVLSWGNGYMLIDRAANGRVLNLWPLRPDRITIYRMGPAELVYVYRYQPSDGSEAKEVAYTQDEILHIPGLGFDGLVGYDVITIARESIGAAMGTEKFAASFWGNGARPGGVLEHPGHLSDDAQKHLRESWQAVYGGPENQNKTAILEEGMKYNALTIPPEAAQFIETKAFNVSEICRWFRMPPRKVGDTSRAQGWSTLEASNTEYLQDTLMPWLVLWEQRTNAKFFSAGDYYSEHVLDSMLRGDTKSRSAFYQSGITSGWMTRNEVRALENLPPLEGLDEPLTPVAVAQKDKQPSSQPDGGDTSEGGGTEEDAEPEPTARGNVDLGFRPIWLKELTAWTKRQANAIRKAHRRPEDFPAWIESFFSEEPAKFRSMIAPAVDGYARGLWAMHSSEAMPQRVADRAAMFASELATRHCESAKQELMEAARSGNGNVDELLDEWLTEGPEYFASVELGNERRTILSAIEGI